MSHKGNNIKVVMIGESGVGKTSIISQFVHNNFEENYTMSTMGSFSSKTLIFEDKSICLDIWDTAGQEKYRSLTKFFYKDAVIVVLVYDITRQVSFDELKNYWYGQVKNFGEKNTIMGIAGNKADLIEKEAVSEQEARKFAKEVGASFYLTSASNNFGIDQMFTNLGKRYLDPNYIELEHDNYRKKTIKLSSQHKRRKSNCC